MDFEAKAVDRHENRLRDRIPDPRGLRHRVSALAEEPFPTKGEEVMLDMFKAVFGRFRKRAEKPAPAPQAAPVQEASAVRVAPARRFSGCAHDRRKARRKAQ